MVGGDRPAKVGAHAAQPAGGRRAKWRTPKALRAARSPAAACLSLFCVRCPAPTPAAPTLPASLGASVAPAASATLLRRRSPPCSPPRSLGQQPLRCPDARCPSPPAWARKGSARRCMPRLPLVGLAAEPLAHSASHALLRCHRRPSRSPSASPSGPRPPSLAVLLAAISPLACCHRAVSMRMPTRSAQIAD